MSSHVLALVGTSSFDLMDLPWLRWDWWVTRFGGAPKPQKQPDPTTMQDEHVQKRSAAQTLAFKRRRGYGHNVVAGALSPGDAGGGSVGGERRATLGSGSIWAG